MPQTSPMNWIIMVFTLFNMYLLVNQILSNMKIDNFFQISQTLIFLSKKYKW